MLKKSLRCLLLTGAVLGVVSAPAVSAVESVRTASRLDRLLAPIKSKQDLDRYLAVTPAYQSAFSPLTPAGRRAFIDSLTFNQSGLTGFSYRDLQAELTPTQIDKLLALFGARNTIALMKPTRVVSMKDRHLLVSLERCGSSECGEDGGSGWDDGGGTPAEPTPPPAPDPSDTTDKDVAGYACVARATCEVKNFSICRKGC
ncbi:hypothetical protein [Rugamonas rivuli]|nr:hypothetical protein [Rugamonas rivuli]